MFRPTLESLEKREVRSANPALAALHPGPPAFVRHADIAKNQDIEVENDEAHIVRHAGERTESVGKDEHVKIGLRGVANSTKSAAAILASPEYSFRTAHVAHRVAVENVAFALEVAGVQEELKWTNAFQAGSAALNRLMEEEGIY
jgi:hypothetical protein